MMKVISVFAPLVFFFRMGSRCIVIPNLLSKVEYCFKGLRSLIAP